MRARWARHGRSHRQARANVTRTLQHFMPNRSRTHAHTRLPCERSSRSEGCTVSAWRKRAFSRSRSCSAWASARPPAAACADATSRRRTHSHPFSNPILETSSCALLAHTLPTSAPGLGSPRPHLRRDWAHPAHICAGTGALRQRSRGAAQSAVLRARHCGTSAERGPGFSAPASPSPGADVGGVSPVPAQM